MMLIEKPSYHRSLLLAILLHIGLLIILYRPMRDTSLLFSPPSLAPLQAVMVMAPSSRFSLPSQKVLAPIQPTIPSTAKPIVSGASPPKMLAIPLPKELRRSLEVAVPQSQEQKKQPRNLSLIKENVQQLLQQAITHHGQPSASQSRASVAKYQGLIIEAIGQQWIMPPNLSDDLRAELAVRLAPGGVVLGVTIVRSSGNSVLDRSAQTAVYKASPLPVPQNPTEFSAFRLFDLVVRPTGLLASG